MKDDGARFQRVKIIATLGPASSRPEDVRALAEAGVDGFRLNTAHLDPSELPGLVDQVRRAETTVGRPLAALCDLAGPKLRLPRTLASRVLEIGDEVTVGAGGDLPVEGFDAAAELTPGMRLTLRDGTVVLEAVAIDGPRVRARVLAGGEVGGGAGVNLPDSETSLPSLTERDLTFIEAGVAAAVDVFALSFVRRAADLEALRRRLAAAGSRAPIIAKLEKAQAVEPGTLTSIVAAADMVMVARGDLGAETSLDRVPVLQKDILRAARAAGVPAITATEMLESMRTAARPTRAEAADVANAVFDGSDALMLTAETAIGARPVEAVRVCARLIATAEPRREYHVGWPRALSATGPADPVADAVARGAVVTAEELEAAAIVCFTGSGLTATLVSRHRPARPVLALTPAPQVARALALVWGVEPRVSPQTPQDHEEVVALASREACAHGVAVRGQIKSKVQSRKSNGPLAEVSSRARAAGPSRGTSAAARRFEVVSRRKAVRAGGHSSPPVNRGRRG
jgi:pyruvate kinase